MLYLLGSKYRYDYDVLNNQLFYVMDTSDLTMERTNAKTILDAIRSGINFDNCMVRYDSIMLYHATIPPMVYEYGNLMVHYIDCEHVNIIYDDMFFSYDGTGYVAEINDVSFLSLRLSRVRRINFTSFSFFGKELRRGKETNVFNMVLSGILCSLDLDTLELRAVCGCYNRGSNRLGRFKGTIIWQGRNNVRYCTIPEYKRHVMIRGHAQGIDTSKPSDISIRNTAALFRDMYK